jgi:hypothetical protein
VSEVCGDDWDGPASPCQDCGEPLTAKMVEHGLEGFGHYRRCCACYDARQRNSVAPHRREVSSDSCEVTENGGPQNANE